LQTWKHEDAHHWQVADHGGRAVGLRRPEPLAPPFIEFAGDGSSGSFGFIAVQGEMNCREVERDGRPGVEFSCGGNDECDPASGPGWAVLEEDGSLRGRIFFRLGGGSGFTAVRAATEDRF
jgi:hypothetical protein